MKSITSQTYRGFFIAGTDTGVGKTTFTRGLLRALNRAGTPHTPYKPVETGVEPGRPSDAEALLLASGTNVPVRCVCPFAFRLPVAPVVAAAQDGIALSVAALLNAAPKQTALVVESAGGLLSPLSQRQTNTDLAAAFGLPVILIGRNSLGTINHTALALAELARRHIRVHALVLVNVAAPGPDAATNARCIEDLTGVRPRLIMPFAPGADDDELASAVMAAGPWT